MIELLNMDNMLFVPTKRFDLIYADMIYENNDLSWIDVYWNFLNVGGVFIVQTDFHTDYLVRERFESKFWSIYNPAVFINHLVWKNEWGNHPKRMMHQCYDDIIIYGKGKDYKFYSDRIQIPKATKTKGLNPSGRETKTATAWIDDICLTTTAKERIKTSDGHLIRWQKPMRLFDRILPQFTDEDDWIFEPFGGTFPACRWAKLNNRNAVGIELDTEVFNIGKKALEET